VNTEIIFEGDVTISVVLQEACTSQKSESLLALVDDGGLPAHSG